MAQKVSVALEDDLDGSPAAETVRFGLGSAPARTEFDEPRENDAIPEHWERVLELQFQLVALQAGRQFR